LGVSLPQCGTKSLYVKGLKEVLKLLGIPSPKFNDHLLMRSVILYKILTKDPTNMFGPHLPLCGEYTSSGKRALKLMLETHFPDPVEIHEESIALRLSSVL
jgi:hypothetical protein